MHLIDLDASGVIGKDFAGAKFFQFGRSTARDVLQTRFFKIRATRSLLERPNRFLNQRWRHSLLKQNEIKIQKSIQSQIKTAIITLLNRSQLILMEILTTHAIALQNGGPTVAVGMR